MIPYVFTQINKQQCSGNLFLLFCSTFWKEEKKLVLTLLFLEIWTLILSNDPSEFINLLSLIVYDFISKHFFY